MARDLFRYFPKALCERFPEALEQHRLRREIIATHLTNSLINRGGPALIARMTDETGASAEDVAKAFAAVRGAYGMIALNAEIDALDNRIPGALQLELYIVLQNLLLDRLVWFLRHVDSTRGLASVIEHYGWRHCRSRGCARYGLAGGRRGGTHRAHRGTGQSQRAGGSRPPHRQPAGLAGGARYRAGGGSQQNGASARSR